MYSSASPEEYEALNGSGPAQKKDMSYFYGGLSLAVVGTLALTMSGGSAAAAIPVAMMAAATETADGAAHVVADAVSQADAYSLVQYDLIYNIFSFAIAAMGASTVFFFFHFSLVGPKYRTAVVITGIVTLIAFYHYMRIFNSFTDAYKNVGGVITATGVPFNDAYRYVDWLLTVPLLLMELILVMDLSPAETQAQCAKLGSAAALMIVLGYPGEITDAASTRWTFWTLAMIPFLFIIYTLFVGLSDAVKNQGPAESLVNAARWITVLSWCTYPIVYIFPMLGLSGASAHAGVQIGYSVADVIAKPGIGLIVWRIASLKSKEVSKYINEASPLTMA
jgi:bacteriorhodopsin